MTRRTDPAPGTRSTDRALPATEGVAENSAGMGVFSRYWGKADPALAVSGLGYHSVLGHSMDVAACAFTLVQRNAVLRAQLSRHSGIDDAAVAITFAALCAIHDVGKLDTRFQRKAAAVADAIRPESLGVHVTSYDHGTEGFREVESNELARELLVEWLGPTPLPLLRAVCGHHGTLPSSDAPNANRVSIKPSLRREDEDTRLAFLKLMREFFRKSGARLPWPKTPDGAQVQRLGGLCAVADWIGSDVLHFPYEPAPTDLDTYWSEACRRAVAACDAAGLLRSPTTRRSFGELFDGYTPRDVQRLTEALVLTEPALIIVEAEMGKGKTEAALSLAARYLGAKVADGITVALPTMATSNAMFARVDALTERLFPGEDVQLALAHSRARRQPRFQRLIARGLQARDVDAPEASVMCARWLLNRKRILLAQVGVGTIDQALQAALVVRHQFVRMFGLSRNVVIIDEVHAYDAYMEVLLEHLLAWLGALGVPVILLSATLPGERRAALAKAWRGEEIVGSFPMDDFEVARSLPYPLVSVSMRGQGSLAQLTSLPLGEESPSRSVAIERSARDTDETTYLEQVAKRLVVAARAGARVVWIRNTVREAQRAYRAVASIAEGVDRVLFHARFRGCDRSRIEQAVLADFGKNAPPGGRVLVATQVVEQSLDLDFDELHTDLAPVDLMFQRAGRLHRHVRQRPPGFLEPRLVVHVPSDADIEALRFGSAQYVYDIATLWIANNALRSRATLALPGDIRPLVEETYHPVQRATLLHAGGERLVAAELLREAQLEAKRTKAKQCCIPPTAAEPTGESTLDDDEDAVQAFTRDGSSTTILPFWWDGDHARSLDATTSDFEWNIDADAPDAWRLASELIDQTLSLPARSDVDGIPGHHTQAWPIWRKRFSRFARDSGLGRRVVPLPMTREGDAHKGWLRIGGKRRRVQYTKTLGLLMLSEKGEEQQR